MSAPDEATGSRGEVEAVAGLEDYVTGPDGYEPIYVIQRYQLLDWLAQRDAAQRADERERVAQAIEALLSSEDAHAVLYGVTGTHPESYGGVTKDEALECAGALLDAFRDLAARIARTGADERVVRVLAAHRMWVSEEGDGWHEPAESGLWCSCSDEELSGWVQTKPNHDDEPDYDAIKVAHVAAALAPVLAEVRAEALREAAEVWPGLKESGGNVYRWLCDRADHIEGTA